MTDRSNAPEPATATARSPRKRGDPSSALSPTTIVPPETKFLHIYQPIKEAKIMQKMPTDLSTYDKYYKWVEPVEEGKQGKYEFVDRKPAEYRKLYQNVFKKPIKGDYASGQYQFSQKHNELTSSCKDHIFCQRPEGVRVRTVDEGYPIFPEFKDMHQKKVDPLKGLEEEPQPANQQRHGFEPVVHRKPSLLVDFLRKDFPYRNIVQKKQAMREGQLPNVYDDRVESYRLVPGGVKQDCPQHGWKKSLGDWELDSHKLAAQLANQKSIRKIQPRNTDNAASLRNSLGANVRSSRGIPNGLQLTQTQAPGSNEFQFRQKRANSVDIGDGYDFIQNSLSEEEFVQRLDRDQMKRFFDSVGFSISPDNYNRIYDRAEEFYKDCSPELAEALKGGVLVRDFQYAFQEFFNLQRERTANEKLKKGLWQFKNIVNPRRDIRPSEVPPGKKITEFCVNLPIEGEIEERAPSKEYYQTSYKRYEQMCDGFPVEFLNQKPEKKDWCCDFISHKLQPGRAEKQSEPITVKSARGELALKNGKVAAEAIELIQDGIEDALNNHYGKKDLEVFECREILVKKGKLKQSQYQQMIMEQMAKDKTKMTSKSSEMRKRADHFLDYMNHRFVQKSPLSGLSNTHGVEKKEDSGKKPEEKKDTKTEERRERERHTKVINDQTFENFIRREAPVILLEEEELKSPLQFYRTRKKDTKQLPLDEGQQNQQQQLPLFDQLTPEVVKMLDGKAKDHKSDEEDAYTMNNYISDENCVRIGKLKHIMHNQKMFAETILVNAKTGKNERKEVTAMMKARSKATEKQNGRSVSLINKPKKMTQFQMYQNRLLEMTSNDKITKVLGQSRKQKLNQQVEDICIQRYVKRRFQEQACEGAKIRPDQMEDIKKKYFGQIIEAYKQRSGRDIDQGIFDDLKQLDEIAAEVYGQLLEEHKGLKVTGGRIKPEDPDEIDNLQIVPEMMDQATAAAQISKVRERKHSPRVEVHEVSEDPDATKRVLGPSKLTNNSLLTEEITENVTDLPTRRTEQKSNMASSPTMGNQTSLRGKSTHMDNELRNKLVSIAKGGNKPGQVYLESDYWYHKGVVLNSLDAREDALECYKQALKLNSSHKASIFNLACAYQKLSQYEEALAQFTQAISVEKEWPDAHYGLSLCCLMLKRYPAALEHILNAERHNIAQYRKKLRDRQHRQKMELLDKKEKILMGNGKTQQALEIDAVLKKSPEGYEKACHDMGLCEEFNKEEHELYIDSATKRNDGVSTHIMYVKALCHRMVKDHRKALIAYARVMKQEDEIGDYEKFIVMPQNQQKLMHKKVEAPGFPGWKVDLYSHFRRLGLLRPANKREMVDLRKDYDMTPGKQGWSVDSSEDIVRDLQRIRFFRRFDSATLLQMMKKTDFRIVQKKQLLFLEPDHCAIVINGRLNLFSHKEDVATPILQAMYGPGDIIGNSKIDGGWSRQMHSWIIAYDACDILLVNREYVDFLWDKMKRSSEETLGWLVERMRAHKWFAKITEQSIYTLAYDMITLKKVRAGHKVCEQATKSALNIEYRVKQQRSVEKFLGWIKGHGTTEVLRRFKEAANPTIHDIMHEQGEVQQYLKEIKDEMNRREAAYGKKSQAEGKDEKKVEDPDATDRQKDKTTLEMFKGYPRNPKTQEELDKEQAKIDEEVFMGRETDKLEHRKEELTQMRAETEKELASLAKLQPLYAKEVGRSVDCHGLNRDLLTGVLQKMEGLLATYRKSRPVGEAKRLREGKEEEGSAEQKLPEDPAGIYILLEGIFTVKSEYNFEDGTMNKPIDLYKKDPKPDGAMKMAQRSSKADSLAHRPESMDVAGAEKFLQVQGYTYYGCLYASSQQSMPTEKKGGKGLGNTLATTTGSRAHRDLSATAGTTFTSHTEEPQSASGARSSTITGFIDEKLLHLLPFYDLYALKDDLQTRYDSQCKLLKANCKNWYSDILGRLK